MANTMVLVMVLSRDSLVSLDEFHQRIFARLTRLPVAKGTPDDDRQRHDDEPHQQQSEQTHAQGLAIQPARPVGG
jgi:hypothetical protein